MTETDAKYKQQSTEDCIDQQPKTINIVIFSSLSVHLFQIIYKYILSLFLSTDKIDLIYVSFSKHISLGIITK